MFKFLRKYNKWILAVGGTLLMIVFLVPQAIEGLSQRAGVATANWASVDGEDVSQREAAQMRSEAEIIEKIQRRGLPIVPGIGDIKTPEHWFLLVREADDTGLVGGRVTVSMDDEQLRQASASFQQPPNVVIGTQANASGIGRMVTLFGSAAQLSDRRLRQHARRMFHTVGAQTVIIEAKADDAGTGAEPTAAEIEAQLEAYADVAPGEGDRGFGYRLPDRFKIEWLTIGVDDVRSMIENSDDMNGVALRRHWRRTEDEIGIPAVVEGAPVPDVVREDLLEQLTAEKLDEIAKFASLQLQSRRRNLPDVDGYHELPDDWEARRLALTELGQAVQEKFNLPLPEYEAIGDRWLTLSDLSELGDLATATTTKFGTPASLAQLIAASREFDGSVTILTQSGVAGPPMTMPDQSIAIYRLTEVDPSRPPSSIDEVREQVVEDLLRLERYEQLLAGKDAVAAAARDNGLVATALEYGTFVQPRTNVSLANVNDVVTYSRAGLVPPERPSALPQPIGIDEAAVADIVEHALALDAGANLEDLPESQRTFVVPVDAKLSLMVVRLLDQSPLTQEQYTSLVANNGLQLMILNQELAEGEVVREAFSYDTLAERHDFKIDRGDPETIDEQIDEDGPADDETGEA